MSINCSDIAKMIDHSLLRPELTKEEVVKGCETAKKYNVASVCCNPTDVALVNEILIDSDVKVTTVIGFPNGYNKTSVKVFEAEQAMDDGAVELDMVINISNMLSRDFDYVLNDIKQVVDCAHQRQVLVKVILENYYLNDELIEKGCNLSEQAGADWVKTSTGFADGGATIKDLQLMRESVSEKVQLKAAGGIRDLEMALKVKEIGCTRFGATRTESIMNECVEKLEMKGEK